MPPSSGLTSKSSKKQALIEPRRPYPTESPPWKLRCLIYCVAHIIHHGPKYFLISLSPVNFWISFFLQPAECRCIYRCHCGASAGNLSESILQSGWSPMSKSEVALHTRHASPSRPCCRYFTRYVRVTCSQPVVNKAMLLATFLSSS